MFSLGMKSKSVYQSFYNFLKCRCGAATVRTGDILNSPTYSTLPYMCFQFGRSVLFSRSNVCTLLLENVCMVQERRKASSCTHTHTHTRPSNEFYAYSTFCCALVSKCKKIRCLIHGYMRHIHLRHTASFHISHTHK